MYNILFINSMEIGLIWLLFILACAADLITYVSDIGTFWPGFFASVEDKGGISTTDPFPECRG